MNCDPAGESRFITVFDDPAGPLISRRGMSAPAHLSPSMNKFIIILIAGLLFAGVSVIAADSSATPIASGTSSATTAPASQPLPPDTGTAKKILDAENLLLYLIIGLIVGAAGQGVRAIVGLKGLQDQVANTPNASMDDLFRARDLVISFGIGGVAGICASLALLASNTDLDIKSILGLMAAGYAGADFIEGFVKQYLPPTNGGSSVTTASDDPNLKAKSSDVPANN
jgi:hypothetical protein